MLGLVLGLVELDSELAEDEEARTPRSRVESRLSRVEEATEYTLSKVSCLVNSKSPIIATSCDASAGDVVEEAVDWRENRDEVRRRCPLEAVQCALRSTFMVNLPFLRICTLSSSSSCCSFSIAAAVASSMSLKSGVEEVRWCKMFELR